MDNPQQFPVTLRIRSETGETLCPGFQIPCGDGYVLRYREAGLEDAVTELSVSSEKAELRRTGAYACTMVFDPVRITDCAYQTPVGVIPLRIRTLRCLWDSRRVLLRYCLQNGDGWEQRQITITVTDAR